MSIDDLNNELRGLFADRDAIAAEISNVNTQHNANLIIAGNDFPRSDEYKVAKINLEMERNRKLAKLNSEIDAIDIRIDIAQRTIDKIKGDEWMKESRVGESHMELLSKLLKVSEQILSELQNKHRGT